MVYIILGHGFEETEALVPCDILRRGGVSVMLAGIGGEFVTGGHGITVKCDCQVEEIGLDGAEMIVFPGGSVGVESIGKSDRAMSIMKEAYEKGLFCAAICAAPTLLGKMGILNGKNAVCYPGLEDEMTGASPADCDCITDGKLITGRAAGASVSSAMHISMHMLPRCGM